MIDLEKEIAERLEQYSNEVIQSVGESVTETGKEVIKALKATSPKHTGRYAKGWRAKPGSDQRLIKNVTVHNATDWQLTHLLEYGHVNRDGTSRTSAKPHIAAAEALAQEVFEKKIKEKLS